MNLAELRKRLLAFPGAREETPFGPDVFVYKVGGRIFALVAHEADPLRLSLKCDPAEALALRSLFAAIVPGYHLNKRHWNTITLDGTVPEEDLLAMIDNSYALIRDRLPARLRP